jgi:hypothetical protein
MHIKISNFTKFLSKLNVLLGQDALSKKEFLMINMNVKILFFFYRKLTKNVLLVFWDAFTNNNIFEIGIKLRLAPTYNFHHFFYNSVLYILFARNCKIWKLGLFPHLKHFIPGNYWTRPRRFYKRRVDVVFAIYIAVVHAWSFFQ